MRQVPVSEELGSGLSAMIPLAGGLGRPTLRTWVPGNAHLFADLDQGATPASRGVAGHNFRRAHGRGHHRHPRSVRRGGCGPHDDDQLAYRERHVAPVSDIGHIGHVAPANDNHDDPVDDHHRGYELLIGHHTALHDHCADHLRRAQYYEHLPAGGTAGHRARRAPQLIERSYDNDGRHLNDLYNGADYRFIDRDHGTPRDDHFHRAKCANNAQRADHLDEANHVDDSRRSCWDVEQSAACNGSL